MRSDGSGWRRPEAHNDRVALSKALEALQPRGSVSATASSQTLTLLWSGALFLSGDTEGAELH